MVPYTSEQTSFKSTPLYVMTKDYCLAFRDFSANLRMFMMSIANIFGFARILCGHLQIRDTGVEL